ncbi:MAG TPA: hypothetical protein VFP17_12525 [Solirubrobacterales bacterium]|nr:hypothetical protein [Solirubrobacterales bacterium]
MKAEPCSSRPAFPGTAAIVAALLSTALLLAIGAPMASAAPEAGPGWAYKANFGSLGPFEVPRTPVAVDGNGNIIASDENLGVIRVYSPTPEGGTQLTEISPVEGLDRNVAVDTSDGTVYADGIFGGPVRRYVSDGAPTPTYSVDPSFGEVPQGEGIAVDAVTGDLLVADPGAEGVRRYDTSGTLVETIATPSVNPAWIVTAPDGSFYVAPAEGPDVTHFSGTGTQLGTISGVGSLHGLSYDPSRSVVVVAVGERLLSYSPAGALLAESPANDGSGRGLAVSASGSLYEQVGSSLNFYVPATVPGVEAPHVSGIVAGSAHVSAEVDPGAGPPEGSVAHFEYSLDSGAHWTSTPDVAVERTGSEEPDTVEADLTGLKPNTDYLVRLVAGNSAITKTSGSTTFRSAAIAPTVVTGSATGTLGSTATLKGSVNPNGSVTTYFFEYGSTASYGDRIPLNPAPAGTGYATLQFTREISGLTPGTTYHFRIVAENSAGTVAGDDQTFVAGSLLSEGRGYEQVTPVEHNGFGIEAQFGALAFSDLPAFSFSLRPAGTEAESAPHYTRMLVRRGSDNWEAPVFPDLPMHRPSVWKLWKSTLAVSADSTHSFAVTNAKLTPDALEEPDAGNLYVKDLETGALQHIASAAGGLERFMDFGYNRELFLGGTKDFSTIVFFSPFPLLPEVTSPAFYRWTRSDGLELASRLPDGSVPSAPVAQQGVKEDRSRRMVSDDGSRILFGIEGGPVYMRIDDETVPVSVSELDGEEKPAIPLATDTAGHFAYFATSARLTSDTAEGEASPSHLYRYDVEADDLEYVGEVNTILSPNEMTLAISPDGESIAYQAPATGLEEEAVLWHQGESTVIGEGFESVLRPFQSGQFSANSRYFAFSVERAYGGSGLGFNGDVYLYDIENKKLSCASCSDGAPTKSSWLPQGERIVNDRLPQVVDDSGRLFFMSNNQLLPQDTNSVTDVYVFHDDERSLISPGKAPSPAYLMDISNDGRDVYFVTDQPLVAQDTNEERDVYDARIGGGFPAQNVLPPPPCEGEGCLGTAPASPSLGAVRTESEAGAVGKPRAKRHHRCKKGRVKVKGKCVKRKGGRSRKPPASTKTTSRGAR